MFDPLLDEDPWIKNKVAESEARGELQALKRVLLTLVQTRFPTLNELAEATVARATQPDALNVLVVQISAAADEPTARGLLEKFLAS